MNRAARAVQRSAPTVRPKSENRTSANRVSGDRFAGADTSSAGEAKDIVGRERDDLVTAASSALVAEVGKFALPVHFFSIDIRSAVPQSYNGRKFALRFI
jgi:hypothetical protein